MYMHICQSQEAFESIAIMGTMNMGTGMLQTLHLYNLAHMQYNLKE